MLDYTPLSNGTKQVFAADLTPDSGRITATFMVVEVGTPPKRNGGHYAALTLGDRTGQIAAKMWDNFEEIIPLLRVGVVVKAQGDVEEYNGAVQLIIQKIRVCDEGEFDLRDYLPASDKSPGELKADLEAIFEKIGYEPLASLAAEFYGDCAGWLVRFLAAPASRRLHHAYIGGAAEQVIAMAKVAETLIGLYPAGAINADLLYAAILLGAVGKADQFKPGVAVEYSDEGELLGAAFLAHAAIVRAAAQLGTPQEIVAQLSHILASSNGRVEWGAARPPMTVEAAIYASLCDLTAQANKVIGLAHQLKDGEAWVERNGRKVYSAPLPAALPVVIEIEEPAVEEAVAA